MLSERRYVSTLLIDKMLLCHGGVNKHGYGLADMLCVDMETR